MLDVSLVMEWKCLQIFFFFRSLFLRCFFFPPYFFNIWAVSKQTLRFHLPTSSDTLFQSKRDSEREWPATLTLKESWYSWKDTVWGFQALLTPVGSQRIQEVTWFLTLFGGFNNNNSQNQLLHRLIDSIQWWEALMEKNEKMPSFLSRTAASFLQCRQLGAA